MGQSQNGLVSSNPNFNSFSSLDWSGELSKTNHIGNSSYISQDFFTSAKTKTVTFTLAISLPGAFANWTPPATLNVYGPDPVTGEKAVKFYPIGGIYGPSFVTIDVGYPQMVGPAAGGTALMESIQTRAPLYCPHRPISTRWMH